MSISFFPLELANPTTPMLAATARLADSSAAYVAFASILVVLYTYVGYPLLVAVWAKFASSPPIHRSDFEPTVTVCLTVYNGEEFLAPKLEDLRALDYPPAKLQFLVFSDGSTDGTERILAEFKARDPRLEFRASRERLGKPTALNELLRLATGDVLLLCDVRQRIGPDSLRVLVEALADPGVGCVSGSLVLAGATGAGAYWRYERLIRRSEARVGGMVGVSGSFYAMRRADMPHLPADLLLDDVFIPLRVAMTTRKRSILAERAEAYDSACDDEREFPRKVRTLAGNYQLIAKMPLLLVPGLNPIWFQTISHKLLRLVCPWVLVLLLLASAALASHRDASTETEFWRAVFAAQGTFYLLALLGPYAGKLGSLARTFVVLNAAAVVGLYRFVRGSQRVTW